jgi:predicted dinucleotide-utilizing enzyme
MKRLLALASILVFTGAFAADPSSQSAAPAEKSTDHRYLVERTFPPGALAGLDAATKRKVNANNAIVGVHWVESYANADKTKTFCIYEGPSESAVRKAAELNKLPVDSITEVPVTLLPK